MELDTTKLRQAGFRKTVTHDNCNVLDIGSGSFPRYIEVRPPGDDGSRMTAIWDGILDLAVNNKVKCIEYGANPIWAIDSMGGNESAVGKIRVNKVFASDFSSESLVTDASDNITINTGTLTLPSDIIHGGDADNKISFTDDVQTYTVGGEVLLTLTEAAQDVVKIGDGGDVDINFNDDMFLQGSDGRFAIGNTGPQSALSILNNTSDETQMITIGGGSTSLYKIFRDRTTGTMKFQGNQTGFNNFNFLDDAGATLLRILENGNVGLNQVSPAFRLQVGDHTSGNRINIQNAELFALGMINTAGGKTAWMGATTAGDYQFSDEPGNALVSFLQTGEVGIGITAPVAKLQVDQFSTIAAIPVLLLDQGDISEQCITFSSDGADRDLKIFDINMTGTPTMLWDESEDGLNWNKAFLIQGLFSTSAGQIKNTTRITSSPYTVLATDNIIIVDTDGGAITVNLPAGIDGTHYRITNVGTAANDITVDPNGTEQLFGGGAGVSFALVDGETINIYFETTENWW